MTFLKNTLTKIWEGLGLASWIEITTANPACTYYFGPFLSEAEAESYQASYVADLQSEGAQGIQVAIKQCRKPDQLTLESTSAQVR